MIKQVWICDICGKEFSYSVNSTDMGEIYLRTPLNKADLNSSETYNFIEYDLCLECSVKIYDMIKQLKKKEK